MLYQYKMQSAKPAYMPILQGITFDGIDTNIKDYQSKTRLIMQLSLAARLDLSFSARFLSRYNLALKVSPFIAQQQVLRYLNGITSYGILYNASSIENLIRYTDSNYASDIVDCKLTTKTCFTLLRGAFAQTLAKQKIVAIAAVYAKYDAIAEATKEAIWIKQFLEEIGILCGAVAIRADS